MLSFHFHVFVTVPLQTETNRLRIHRFKTAKLSFKKEKLTVSEFQGLKFRGLSFQGLKFRGLTFRQCEFSRSEFSRMLHDKLINIHSCYM